MTQPQQSRRQQMDAFAKALNPKGMPPRPEAAPWEKHARIATTTELDGAANSENARSYKKSGHTAPAPISVRAAQLADCLTVLPAHEADALDDRYLWEFLGDKSERESKGAAYRRMMERRDIIALTTEGLAECYPSE